MNLTTIVNAIKLAGSSAPAFKALFDHAVAAFSETDQATLKRAYADEMARSDAAHADVQNALR